MKSLVAIMVLCSTILWDVPAQQFVLSGSVHDSSTREPLEAAHLRIAGTSMGTITNADGYYRLSLPQSSYKVIVSFVGYRSDTMSVVLNSDIVRNVELVPTAIQYAEIVVTDEDPAYGIMRTVIERKSQWQRLLKTYEFEAFTRQVLRRDTAIASITESYTTGYWQQGDTLREVVKQRRQTRNVSLSQNFASVGGIVNFYDDDIRFSGFTFVGPTSPEAFDYYAFRLEGVRKRNGVDLYTIRITPRTKVTPLFTGTMSIIGDSYAVVGIEVSPNEAYRIPFVNDLDIRYAQQFGLYDSVFWMPVDIRLRGSLKIGIAGFTFPAIGFELVSSIYNYRLNVPLPDSLAHKQRRVIAPDAEKFDSTFWKEKEVLALTAEEQHAYRTLDSSQTLEKQFEPSGPLMALGAASEGALKYVDLHFNRAEGFFLGGNAVLDSVTNRLSISVAAGYGFADKKGKGSVGVEWYLDESRQWSVGAQAYNELHHFPDAGFYETLSITLSALLDKVDQRDYYYAEGWKLFASAKPLSRLTVRVTYSSESNTSANQRTDFSFFNRSERYRIQPTSDEGMLRSLAVSVGHGDSPVPLGILLRNFIEVEAERSDRSLLKSSFRFTRLSINGEFFVPTFLKRNLFPPTLAGTFAGGLSDGVLPRQKIFTLEGRSIGYGPMGLLRGSNLKEFTGDAFAMLCLEHNFRSIPFLALNIPFLYKNSIELLVHSSVAKSWASRSARIPYGRTTDGWYSEAGFGLARIFGLFRIDLTRRLVHPASWHVTIAAARLL